jgi:hypothetical protein
MHTSQSLVAAMFSVDMDGQPATRDDLIRPHSFVRVGIVVGEPLGALGASLMLQLGITAYYDVTEKERRSYPHYAEVYVFHMGRRMGDYSPFDIWPARREIDVSTNGADVLAAINAHAITHLLLPDGSVPNAAHYFKEPNIAFDRIERCFLYDPSGRTRDANIKISTADPSPMKDIGHTLDPHGCYAYFNDIANWPTDPFEREDHRSWLESLKTRLQEITDDERAAAKRTRSALVQNEVTTETYREVTVAEALTRLGR